MSIAQASTLYGGVALLISIRINVGTLLLLLLLSMSIAQVSTVCGGVALLLLSIRINIGTVLLLTPFPFLCRSLARNDAQR